MYKVRFYEFLDAVWSNLPEILEKGECVKASRVLNETFVTEAYTTSLLHLRLHANMHLL